MNHRVCRTDSDVPGPVETPHHRGKPNTVYVGDITCRPISDGSNMYLGTDIDCYSRPLTGLTFADHMHTKL